MKSVMYVFCFTLLSLCVQLSGVAQINYTVSDSHRSALIEGQYLGLIVDTSNSLTIEKALVKKFNQSPDGYQMLRKQDVNHWGKMHLKIENKHSYLLEFPDHRLDFIDVYFLENNQIIKSYHSGDHRSFDSRPITHKNFIFPIPKTEGPVLTVIYKTRAHQNAGFGCLLRSTPFFVKYSTYEYLMLGVFYGILFLVFTLNVLVFLKNKSLSPLYYSLYIFSFIVFSMSQDGFLFQFIWPSDLSMYNYVFEIAVFLAVIFQYLYAFTFLDIKKYSPRFYKLCLVVLSVRVLFFVCFLISPNTSNSTLLYDSLTLLPLYYASIKVYKKGYLPARLFIVGNTFFYLGMTVHALESFGLLDNRSVFTVYSSQLGVMIEMLTQTLAFADKLNFEKKQKLDLQSQLINSLKKNEKLQVMLIEEFKEKEYLKDKVNRELEIKVSERTNELQLSMEQISIQSQQIEKMNQEMDKAYYDLKKQGKKNLSEKVFRISSEEDFIEAFSSDQDCLEFLVKLKWNPFVCPKCQNSSAVKGIKPYTRRCKNCNFVDSATANTILHSTRIPLLKAFQIIMHVFHDRKTSLESLAQKLELRKGTVYDFAKKVKKKKENLKEVSLKGVFLND